ncbi:hypothetical protein SAMN05660330_02121 [Desulforhopalus singaporensis]|uniref:Uncharacterized protein n=1 Tax=Desulforhopalus singaporensis TaxID=91360 RepID=A0A1H0QXN3_9BACT|nr:hypothetical protein SAMN05660330_02121 [Desulforhopalus singaporensis]
MLTVVCAACRSKLWRYDKIGHGHVVRCHKARITKWHKAETRGHKLYCPCGKPVAIDKGGHYRMIAGNFTHTGTKRNKR